MPSSSFSAPQLYVLPLILFVSASLLLVLFSSSSFTSFVIAENAKTNSNEQALQPDDNEASSSSSSSSNENKHQEQQLKQRSILREQVEADFDHSDILIIDQPDISELHILKETHRFASSGVRVLKFGSSYQSAVATLKNLPPNADNTSFPPQEVDWSAPPVFRYMNVISQAFPFYELRAEKFRLAMNEKENTNKENHHEEKNTNKNEQETTPETIENILVVGMGSGSVIKHLEKLHPRGKFSRADAIELEPEVIRLAEEYFDFKNGTDATNIFEGDAFEVLDREENKFNNDMKYDLIVLDCAASGNTFHNDPLYPLRPKDVAQLPDIAQPLSCFKPLFVKLLANFYLRNKETSLVVANYLGFIEPAGHIAQKPTLRVLKTFKSSFQRDERPIVVPTLLRKWKNGFRPTETGHRNARIFDNHLIFVTWKNTYEPTVDELVKKVEDEISPEKNGGYQNSRYFKISPTSGAQDGQKFYLDLIRNRYERRLKEMEDEVVILPRTEKKKPTIKVKELPDDYVPLEDRESDPKLKKKMRGSIWHEY